VGKKKRISQGLEQRRMKKTKIAQLWAFCFWKK
jgi:hypothetical protein